MPKSKTTSLLWALRHLMTEGKKLSPYSLDEQIDSFLLGYENDSKAADEPIKQESRRLSLSLLLEAPDDEEDDSKEDDKEGEDDLSSLFNDDVAPGQEEPEDKDKSGDEKSEDDSPGEEVADSSRIKASGPQKDSGAPIDIDQFALRVARLVENYDSLLDIRTVIVNRSFQYMIQTHDQSVADRLRDTLSSQHDIDLDKDPDDRPERPIAAGAGPIS